MGVEGSKCRFRCSFAILMKKGRKTHSKLFKTFYRFNQGAVFIVIEKHLTSIVIQTLGILGVRP